MRCFKSFLRVVPIIVLTCFLSTSYAQDRSLLRLLPTGDSIGKWHPVDTARIYEGNDLFLFIDGGADVFLEYGFRRVVAVEYQNNQEKSVNLEIYEMDDAQAAYGIYSIRTSERATEVRLGQEGRSQRDYIMFWKGKYYVSVAGLDSTSQCREGMEVLARAVDRNIIDQGEKPLVLKYLPREGLLGERYIRGFLGLSLVYAFHVRDAFRMKDAAVGIYEDQTVIFLRNGDSLEARRRFSAIENYLKSDERFDRFHSQEHIDMVADKKDRTLCIGQSGQYVIIVISSNASKAWMTCKAMKDGL